jgi:uncharacterized protein (DUF2147 family)
MMKYLLAVSTCLFLFSALSAQSSPEGVWMTIDDNTGEAKSHIEIYAQNGKYHGKIVKLLRREPDTVCEKCKGDKKNRPLLGMLVIEGLEPHQDHWRRGTILDPESGNEYVCSVWFEKGNTQELKVRGRHWTGLYRTQTWRRVR